MIDVKLLREKPETVEKLISSRGPRSGEAIKVLIKKDAEHKRILSRVEELRASRNRATEEVKKFKMEGNDSAAEKALAFANGIKSELAGAEKILSETWTGLTLAALSVPNIPDESVPPGAGDADNKTVFEDFSEKRDFDFKPLDHHSLGEKIGVLDFARAALLAGSRFPLLRGDGAGLERALAQFMLDVHTGENGYEEILPPLLVNSETMTGTGQLPKFEEDLYRTCGDPPMYLVPTAEVPLTNLHAGKVLSENDLPLKYAAHTPCFRQEAGSYGKDTRGLIRNHQFNKVELVWIVKPEDSMDALEKLRGHAEKILRLLKLPFRTVELCSGDLGFASARTYDLEVWMPGEGRFREISSCSNCRDFQSRRMNSRFKRNSGGKPEFVHTLNGSGLAVGRTFAAVLENFQNRDNTVTVPEVLREYMGKEKIG